MQKKGQQGLGMLNILLTGGIILVIVAVALGVGGNVLSTLKATQTADGFAYNASAQGETGLGNMAGNLGLIGTVVGLSVVLLILVALLFRQFSRGV